LSQGGIVPSYALIVRQYFPRARPAGDRAGADGDRHGHGIGGWLSGEIYDLDRLLPGRVPQRLRLEPAQHEHRVLAAPQPLRRVAGFGAA
jgi:hypothetical protein